MKMKKDIRIAIANINNYQVLIETKNYNPRFFNNSGELIDAYGIVITDYLNFLEFEKTNKSLIDFFKDSVKNSSLSDLIIEDYDFQIKDDVIKLLSDKTDFVNMGEFHINHFIIFACNSYLFIIDTEINKKYMYYGD
jgi:hypothetical protein